MLGNLPDTPERARQELLLHLALGGPLIVTRGYSSAELRASTDRARELVEQVGSVEQRFDVLYRPWAHRLVGAQHAVARTVAEEFLHRAGQEGDPGLVLMGHRTLGVTLFLQGEPESARQNLDRALALYDPESHRALAQRFGQEPRSACQAVLAPVSWLLGFPEQSARWAEEAVAGARDSGHFNTLAYAIYFGSLTSAAFHCDFEALARHARALMTIGEEQGAALWVAVAAMVEGLTQIRRGELEQGLARFARARDDWHATGTRFNDPLFAALLSEVHLRDGRLADGFAAVDEALEMAHGTGELGWEAEMHRLRGELLLAASELGGAGAPGSAGVPGRAEPPRTGRVPDAAEGEACLVRALEIARRQAAKSLELRAATSLGRLWQRRGERRAAADLLAPVYRWFTEGLDTADLTEAKALLEELG